MLTIYSFCHNFLKKMEHRIEETTIDENFWSDTDKNVCEKTSTSTDNDSTMFMEIIPRNTYYDEPSTSTTVAPEPSIQLPSTTVVPEPSIQLPSTTVAPEPSIQLPSTTVVQELSIQLPSPPNNEPIMPQSSPKHIQCVQNLGITKPTLLPPTRDNVYKENEYIQYVTKEFNQEHIGSIDKFRNTFTDVSDDFRKYMDNAITINCAKLQESIDNDTVEYEKSITLSLSSMIQKMEEEIKIYADKAKKLCEGLILESTEYNIIRVEQDAISKLKDEITKRELSLAEKINNKRKMN